jgi:putative transposase
LFVNPETVMRWHRAGFRFNWTWLSRRRAAGRPTINPTIPRLIRRMVTENPTWGSPRIHGDLRMLGIDVERTVSRYLPRRPLRPDGAQRWLVFLRNHRRGIAAMDFFVVPTVTLRLAYVWFAMDHGRRRILHFEITAAAAKTWDPVRIALSPGQSESISWPRRHVG